MAVDLVALAVVLPTGVALSRMYRGMHHPTDFMGAIILTALWVGVLYWVIDPRDIARAISRASSRRTSTPSTTELAKAGRAD